MLIDHVSDSIQGYIYVSSWLERVANVPYQEITKENLSKYRKRWLEELIKEYKSKEKINKSTPTKVSLHT